MELKMFSVREILDIAVRIERNGEKVYRSASKKVSDTALASLLGWLADEEVHHAEWFEGIRENIKEIPDDPSLEEMGRAILGNVLSDQSFSLQDKDLTKMETVGELLETAIEFEKDTVLFFEMLRSFIEDRETLLHLDKIIEQERQHVKVLEEFQGERTVANL
jgi:rubrerythrin